MTNKRAERDANRDLITGEPRVHPSGIGVAERVNPTAEDAYWRENYSMRPYVSADLDYTFYQPAYRYGWEARGRYDGRTWDDVEDELATGWYVVRGTSVLEWDDAKPATRDAWDRVDGRARIDSRR